MSWLEDLASEELVVRQARHDLDEARGDVHAVGVQPVCSGMEPQGPLAERVGQIRQIAPCEPPSLAEIDVAILRAVTDAGGVRQDVTDRRKYPASARVLPMTAVITSRPPASASGLGVSLTTSQTQIGARANSRRMSSETSPA